MIKFIAFTDVHGNTEKLSALIPELESCDHAFFLGDGLRALDLLTESLQSKVTAVRGNCDFFSQKSEQLIVDMFDKKFMVTHGDAYGVKKGSANIIRAAKILSVDIVLFGHTHEFNSWVDSGITFVNAGCLNGGTYAEIILNEGNFAVTKKYI